MRRIPALLFVAGLVAAPASVAARPSNQPSTSQVVERFEWSTAKGRLGAMVMGLTPELRKHFNVPEDRGVLVARVDPGTPAAAAGLAVGDVIVEVHGKKIDSAPDMLSALATIGKGDHATIEVVRDGKTRTLDATLTEDARASTWSPPWLDEWMKPFESHALAWPMDADWWKPFDLRTHDPDPADSPKWLDKVCRMFAPQSGPLCQRS